MNIQLIILPLFFICAFVAKAAFLEENSLSLIEFEEKNHKLNDLVKEAFEARVNSKAHQFLNVKVCYFTQTNLALTLCLADMSCFKSSEDLFKKGSFIFLPHVLNSVSEYKTAPGCLIQATHENLNERLRFLQKVLLDKKSSKNSLTHVTYLIKNCVEKKFLKTDEKKFGAVEKFIFEECLPRSYPASNS